jgi:hypothetical protein
MALRISPSPDCCDDIEPLANTMPARPLLDRRASMCCSQAKLALPSGGMPYPPRVIFELVAVPIADVERRVGKDVVGPQCLVLVVGEGGSVGLADVPVQPMNGEVHQTQATGLRHQLLPVDRQVALLAQRRWCASLNLAD